MSALASQVRQEWAAWGKRFSAMRGLGQAAKLVWKSGPTLVFWSLLLRFVVAVVPVLSLWVGKVIIDAVASSAARPGALAPQLWLPVSAAFALAAAATTLGRVIDYCDGRVADEFSRDVSEKVLRHASTLEYAQFEDPHFQDLLERARLQATDRTEMLSDGGRFIQQAIALVALSTASVALSPKLFLLVVACMIPAFLSESHFAFLSYALSHEVTPLRRELDYLRELCTSRVSVKEIKLFRLGGYFEKRFAALTEDLIDRNTRLARRRLFSGSLFAVVGSVGYFGAYALLVASAMRGEITVGTLTFLSGVLAASSGGIQSLFSLFSKLADEALFLNDLFSFFALKPAAPARPAPPPGPKLVKPSREGIEFRDVSFQYPGAGEPVLRNVSFKIGPKESVALVGANGQGKTTLVKLLSRLYEPTSGVIYYNGRDLRDYDAEELREEIGIIFQDFVRYEMTAAENIAVGRISAIGDAGLLDEAAARSGADGVLAKLPNGLSQLLGRRFEGGVDLSGGEWQKIALARAYLRKANILVLDEPTAALDAQAEHEVFAKLAELTERNMVLLISHRFSTVRMADRILVLEEGSILEEGTHEELMEMGGRYAGLFELQAASYR